MKKFILKNLKNLVIIFHNTKFTKKLGIECIAKQYSLSH